MSAFSAALLDRYPQRLARDAAGARGSRWRTPLFHGTEAVSVRARLGALDAPSRQTELQDALAAEAARLRRRGLEAAHDGHALALVALLAARVLGKTAFPGQLVAAAALLDGRLVELATGEGKTLAAALAASVAAMAGVPVHVLTANDYLAQRDRAEHAPLYEALGLSHACVTPTLDRAARHAAWRHDIVHATAKEMAFDYLRDHLLLGGERDPRRLRARVFAQGAIAPGAFAQAGAGGVNAEPVLPGLRMAIVDEADSVLLDEATMPLVVSAPTPSFDAPAWRCAFNFAGALSEGRDYRLVGGGRVAVLSPDGRERVALALRGAVSPARLAHELAEAALAALHCYQRDREYALVDGAITLIDPNTGRIAEGRQWSGPLHAMVQMKEGLKPSPPLASAARISYQQLFPRYLRLAGMSGTLNEARAELRGHYDAPVLQVAPARPSARRWLGSTVFASARAQWQAVAEHAAELSRQGRPVLIGTASVAASNALSARLTQAGIAHQVLNALQDADEAAQVARAGERGVVTVSTNIAGRGTDIRLGAGVAALGGLHVIATMKNRSRRIDRQLFGRCARQGDPGSAQSLLSLEDTLLRAACPRGLLALAARCGSAGHVPAWLAWPLFALAQRAAELQDRLARARLRRAGSGQDEIYAFAGGTE